jgi:hypothetical protein
MTFPKPTDSPILASTCEPLVKRRMNAQTL